VYLLYLVFPLLLTSATLSLVPQGVEEGILKLPVAMCWVSGLLVGWNGLRTWGYGVLLNDRLGR